MIGKTISHYKILEKLGEGGMGVVYKAQDTKLDRIVALKFLPEHLLCDEEAKRRFVHEARAASALNHPNITTIHEIDEVKGECFICMEYIEGKSIKELIKEKEFSLDEILRMAIQIAEGLNAAHKKGIVHRDIKSDNIMVNDQGLVKIMDFGLAKLKGVTKLTKTGSTLGTLHYMSPEQASREAVDSRSDIFSLGVVLYEIITGQLPFRGEQEAAVVYSIVNENPEPLARYKSDVPEEIKRIVEKGMEKNRDMRYQHVDDLQADLRKLRKELELIASKQYPSAEKAQSSIAVLPFADMSPNKDQEYFCDGLAEELINSLTRIKDLHVVARTSAFAFKGKKLDIREIGRRLNVKTVLEGSVRKAANRLRMTTQLINVADGYHIWAETYNREMEDIFDIQSEIAEKVVKELNVTLLGPERQAIETKPTDNLDAYNAYLRALNLSRQPDYSEENLRLVVQMLNRATELDPNFALAHAELARAHSTIYHFGYDRTEQRLARAKAAVDRALELQPELPEAHLAYGWYHYEGYREYDRALEEFALAEQNLPNDSRVIYAFATIHKRQGRFEQAVEYLKRAFELSPQDANPPWEIGISLEYLRRYSEVEHYYDRVTSLAPDQGVGYAYKADLYRRWKGDLKKARATLERIPDKTSERWLMTWHLQELFERNYQAALDRLASASEEFFESQSTFDPKSLYAGLVYEFMNQPELARASYDSARVLLEAKMKESPDDHRLHNPLGVAYAGLGRNQEAIREGKLSLELFPVSKDIIEGTSRVEGLAHIYTMVGGYKDAVDQIEYLLSIPSILSVALLRLDPRWDPLRDHPRFQKLLEEAE